MLEVQQITNLLKCLLLLVKIFGLGVKIFILHLVCCDFEGYTNKKDQ